MKELLGFISTVLWKCMRMDVILCLWAFQIWVAESDLLFLLLVLHCCVAALSLSVSFNPHCPCRLHSFTHCIPASQRCSDRMMLHWLTYSTAPSSLYLPFIWLMGTCSGSNVSTASFFTFLSFFFVHIFIHYTSVATVTIATIIALHVLCMYC